MEAVVEAGEGGMVDGIAAQVAHSVFVEPKTTVVLQLQAEVAGRRLLPEIEAAGYLGIRHEGRVLGVVGMDIIVEVNEGEGRTPGIGIEEFEGSGDAVGTLVGTCGIERTEVVVELQVGACTRAKRAQTQAYNQRYF